MRSRDPEAVRRLTVAALERLFPNAQRAGHHPTVRQRMEDPEIIAGRGAVAPTPAVQHAPRSAGLTLSKVTHKSDSEKEWKWTPKKREALRLTVDGVPIGIVAEKVKRHRNTIRAWWNNPVFANEVRLRSMEKATSTKLRHPHRAGVLAEALFQKSVKVLADEEKTGKLDVGKATLLLREFRDNQRLEAEAINGGSPVQRHEHHHLFDNTGEVNGSARAKASEPLLKFLEGYDPTLTKQLTAAKTQDELVVAMRRVAMETPIVDVIQEAAREEAHDEAQTYAAEHRRR